MPSISKEPTENAVSYAREVIQIEVDAIAALLERIGPEFEQACKRLLACKGRVVVTGMGKSGHVGGKIASTLASTGTPAFFVHPGEASHGDLGMITPDDLVIAIANSGETPEIINILPVVKRISSGLIVLTGNTTSRLANAADVCLDVSVAKEACPHNLAPTASSTATLVMGDALAVAVQKLRGFSEMDFARTHPGGTLGKRLLLYAADLMHSGDELPLVGEGAKIQDLLLEMSSKSLGMVGVVDSQRRLIGMFTDGDLRRALASGVNVYESSAMEVVNKNPFTISADTLAAEIVKIMRDYAQQGPHAINGLFVTDKNQGVVGALNTHDLLRAGVI